MDIKTVMLALAVGYLVFGLMLFLFQLREEPSRRIPFWATGKTLQGVGMLLLYGRAFSIPDFLGMTVANACLLSGFAYECWAMLWISERPVSRDLHAVSAVAIVLICCSFPYLTASTRIVVASAIHAIFLALPGWAMLTHAGERSPLRTCIGWSFWLLAALLFARFLYAGFMPDGLTLFSANAVHVVMFVFLYVMMLVSGFGILMLSKETSDQEVRNVLNEQEAILNTLPTGLCILRNRVIERCNPAMEAMFGFAPGTLIGRSVRCLYETDQDFDDYGRKIYSAIEQDDRFEGEVFYIRQNGEKFWACDQGTTIFPERTQAHSVFSVTDITRRKQQAEILALQKEELEATLARIKRLEGIIPICMYCKKIRNEEKSWEKLEQYISAHTDALFSHGICPDCADRARKEWTQSE